jgi:hypothetical protein
VRAGNWQAVIALLLGRICRPSSARSTADPCQGHLPPAGRLHTLCNLPFLHR